LTLTQNKRRSPSTPAKILPVSVSTGIDPADCFHKRLQPRASVFAFSYVSQRPRPFADHFIISGAARRAANNRSERISVSVKRLIDKFKRVPQQLFGPPPLSEMHDDREYRLQIPIHSIAGATSLKLVPRIRDPFQPSGRSVASSFTI
jgi:hypothetical protein